MNTSLLIKELTFDEIQKVAGGSASGTVKFVPNKSFGRKWGLCLIPIGRGGFKPGDLPGCVNRVN